LQPILFGTSERKLLAAYFELLRQQFGTRSTFAGAFTRTHVGAA
jgi:hypothetical protein